MTRLVADATAGDERAWNRLVGEFGGLVWSAARACGLNEADAADVSQIAWQRLFEHLPRLREPARVGGWLATTARREAMRRRSSRTPIPFGDDLPEQAADLPAPATALLDAERDAALAAALADLPERDRMLLRILMAEPAPHYSDVAAAMDMPIGSVGPTRARALARLSRAARRHGLHGPER